MTAELFSPSPAAPDARLLDALRDRRDPAAFAALVARHGRMVLGVCRRVLRHDADEEDAFQATFVVLLRQPPPRATGSSLGGWLHTVAVRVALRARRRRADRRRLEATAAANRDDAASEQRDPPWAADLDEALAALPPEYREPLTLCHLEGKTSDEAAAELGCSRSTLTRRLTTGRALLRRRLETLGATVPAAAIVALLENVARGAEPSAASLAALATPNASGVSATATALAKSGANAGLGSAALALVATLALAFLAGAVAWQRPHDRPAVAGAPPVAAPSREASPATVVAPLSASPEEARATPASRTAPVPAPPAEMVAKAPRAIPAPGEPKLRDRQLVSSWAWDKFQWREVDATRTRPVKFGVVAPPGHRFVTVAIDDASGTRVRNLLDAVEIEKLGGDPHASEPQTLSVEWNGLDDDGRALPDGTYRVRGCSHRGMKLVYEYSFLNPGTPPWEHYPHSGWGGDHGFPHAIACLRGHGGGKWRVAVGGHTAEGGSPGFVLDANDRKCHAFGRGWSGPKALAADGERLWIALGGGKDLVRIEYHTGRQIPFAAPKGPLAALTFDSDAWGLAVGDKIAAALLHDEKRPERDRVVLFHKESGEGRIEIPLPSPGRRNGLAFAHSGSTLFVATDAGLFSVAVDEPKPTLVPRSLPGLVKPGPLAADAAGNLYVVDRGPDYRVKVFDSENRLVREIGTPGGQGERLEFDPAALHGVEAISVDDEGNLWAAEQGETDARPNQGFVRRIATWRADGSFHKDFVGTTWYAANNTCLHEQDPTLALGYGVIYRLRPGEKPGYRPWKYLTRGKPDDAALWHWTGAPWTLFGSVRMFRSDASGEPREYVLQSNGFPILFRADESGEYLPALAIGSHEHHKVFPRVADEPKALFLWTDANEDAKPQDDEFQRLPGATYQADLGVGHPPSRAFEFCVEGIVLRPAKFTPRGVPLYDVATAPRLPIPQHYLPVGEHWVAGVSGTFNSPRDGVYQAGHRLFVRRDGTLAARYRVNWGGVHASWSSIPSYTPGQVGRSIGDLHYAGVVDSRSDVGKLVAVQGNYGQSFLWSEDGLFVAALFKDSRLNPKGWGATEEFGADWSDVSLYAECFGGMICRQDDGKVRYLFGRNGCHVVRVEGLEDVKRLDAGSIELAGPTVGGIAAPPPDAEDRVLRVPNVSGRHPPFVADGEAREWAGVARREIKVGDEVVARIAAAHTRSHLWLLAEVVDPSPWVNAGEDPKLAFKTGDAIDLRLGTDREPRPFAHLTDRPSSDPTPPSPERVAPAIGDLRVLIAPGPNGAAARAIAYRPVKPGAKPEERTLYESPVHRAEFDSVVALSEAKVGVKRMETGYAVEVQLPCDRIDLRDAAPGLRLRGDLGVLWGNEAGLVTERRAYLFDRGPAAAVVSDAPTEAALRPNEWGAWLLE